MAEFDYKKYARMLRENCIKDDNGNIVCSSVLWEQIASTIENVDTSKREAVQLSKEDQIEEIMEIMSKSCESCFGPTDAELLYNSGYRKVCDKFQE